MLGYKFGDGYPYHFVKGSELAVIGETLGSLGLEPVWVSARKVSIDDSYKIPQIINEYLQKIVDLGSNPFKGF